MRHPAVLAKSRGYLDSFCCSLGYLGGHKVSGYPLPVPLIQIKPAIPVNNNHKNYRMSRNKPNKKHIRSIFRKLQTFTERCKRSGNKEIDCSGRMRVSGEVMNHAELKDLIPPFSPLLWILSATFIYGLGSLWLFYKCVSFLLINDRIDKSKDCPFSSLYIFHIP